MDWEAIVEEWHGAVTHAGIAEAVRLARTALLAHPDEALVEPTGG